MAVRSLPAEPAATVQARPIQHPAPTVVGWSIVLIAIFASTAVLRYRRKVRR
jgi:hypothetical protein